MWRFNINECIRLKHVLSFYQLLLMKWIWRVAKCFLKSLLFSSKSLLISDRDLMETGMELMLASEFYFIGPLAVLVSLTECERCVPWPPEAIYSVFWLPLVIIIWCLEPNLVRMIAYAGVSLNRLNVIPSGFYYWFDLKSRHRYTPSVKAEDKFKFQPSFNIFSPF